MRDSLGGLVNIVIIVVFVVIVSGYMAFNVNYTKAFKMKNKIISYYDDFNGKCDTNFNCRKKITDYAKSIGYRPADMVCPTGYAKKQDLYCVKEIKGNKSNASYSDERESSYFKIITKINIEIPIVDNVFNIKVFNVSGDTKVYVDRSKW